MRRKKIQQGIKLCKEKIERQKSAKKKKGKNGTKNIKKKLGQKIGGVFLLKKTNKKFKKVENNSKNDGNKLKYQAKNFSKKMRKEKKPHKKF